MVRGQRTIRGSDMVIDASTITAAGVFLTALGLFIAQMVGLLRLRAVHDLVNSMSVDKLREAKEAAFAEGKLAGKLELQASYAPNPGGQLPQIPVPKE